MTREKKRWNDEIIKKIEEKSTHLSVNEGTTSNSRAHSHNPRHTKTMMHKKNADELGGNHESCIDKRFVAFDVAWIIFDLEVIDY